MSAPQPDYFGKTRSRADQQAARKAREAEQQLNNRRLGMLIFQGSWMLVFLLLVFVNWQLRSKYTTWPPAGVQPMGVWLASAATLGLFASVIFARRGLQRAKADDLHGLLNNWRWTLLLGGLFVAVMVAEWFIADRIDPLDTQYQALFRMMTGFHLVHALAIGVYIWQVFRTAQFAQQGAPVERYGSANVWAVESAVNLWDFVFAAWLLFYIVLYWWRTY
ncbi:MAG: cytochrome c oxidase subunit 3 [Phototrophicaceae bacterium]|jgi:heme/copper-type cytochrome/quinol oxidase subunit 3